MSEDWIPTFDMVLRLAIALVFGAIGMGLDHWLAMRTPWLTALGATMGFVLGLIRFIRLAGAISQNQREFERARDSDD